MKKTRLLEIVREEISEALNVLVTNKKGETTTMPYNTPDEKKSVMNLKQDSNITNIETTAGQNIKETEQSSKYKQLSEKYQLDEDTINEMASIVQTKKVLTKLGDEKRLELVKNVEKETLDQFKKDPIMSSDGRLARKLDPEEQTGKKDTRGFGADFERNFKKKAGMDFLDFTTQIDIELKKKFPEEKFTPGLATNTTEKEAASQIFGLEKGQRGRKADPNKPEKPESTGKKGRPAGEPKAEKTATRTPGADGFDDVSYSDVEDIDTEKAPAGDVEMEKAARGKDELVKQYKSEVEPELKNKIAKAKEGDKEAMAWLKSKQDIIKKYNQAKQVKA